MFIRIAVRELEPATMVDLRLWIAAPVLVAFVIWRSGPDAGAQELRRAAGPGVVIGVLNAVPFTLVAWSEQVVDSGIAAVAMATIPIFVLALAAIVVPSERVTRLRLLGFLLGLVGVGVMAGFHPDPTLATFAGIGVLLLAAILFAGSQVYSQLKIGANSGPALAATGMSSAAVMLLPFALLQLPTGLPSWSVIASVVALALVSTVAFQLIFYGMISRYGVARTTVGGYLVPAAALLFGAAILGEPITEGKALGLILILLGVAIGAGIGRRPPTTVVSSRP